MYMDGVDFVPASRSVLYGYHFKSIAAAGPIVGAITAANLWGWLPSIIWLLLGVTFIGWMSDYSAIMVSVRNDGNSLSAIAHRLIAPRTRTILLVFIFFYLLLVAGAFGKIITDVLFGQPQVPLAIVTLVIMGLLGGQMLYKWKTDLMVMTLVTVGLTLLMVVVGALGMSVNPPAAQGAAPTIVQGPIGQLMVGFNNVINAITGGKPVITYYDPTLPLPPDTPQGVAVPNVNITPAFLFWLVFLCAFAYLGSILPIWRFAQPINYIGFWITFLTIVLAGLGAALAIVLKPDVASLKIAAITSPALGFAMEAGKAWQPLWPM